MGTQLLNIQKSVYNKYIDYKSVVGLVCIYSNRQDVFENVNRQRSE